MLDEIASETVHKDENGGPQRKKKQDTKWSKASQKDKEQSIEFFEMHDIKREAPPSYN